MLKIAKTGLALEQNKDPAISRSIVNFTGINEVYVPLNYFKDGQYSLLVNIGEEVRMHSPIAKIPDEDIFIYSPINGIVKGTEKKSYLAQKDLECLVIMNTEENIVYKKKNKKSKDFPEQIERTDIIYMAKSAAIIDEIDGELLYKKLVKAYKENTNMVCADAIEDQPFTSSALRTLIDYGDDVAYGVRLAMSAVGANDCLICAFIDDNVANKISTYYGNVKVYNVTGNYPAGRDFIKYISNAKMPVFIGVKACKALYEACANKIPQTTATVTVDGDAISSPLNVRAPIGTPIIELLEFCGLNEPIMHIIANGPLTGYIVDPDTPLLAVMNSITLYQKKSMRIVKNCNGCGKCCRNCPANLLPCYVISAVERNDFSECNRLNISKCFHCNICSYSCPSGINISKIIYDAQKKINNANRRNSRGNNL